MTEDTIKINILADVKDAIEGFSKAAIGTASLYKAFKELIKLGKEMVQAFIQEENAIIKVNAALRITGQYSKDASNTITAYAMAIHNSTTFTREAAQESAALLMQLGNLTTQGVQKILPVIADFAASMGIDMVSAASLVGKALDGSTGALSRYGIKIKETGDSEIRFNEILTEMNSKFYGMAEALAEDTLGGKLTNLKKSFDDLKASGGGLLAEVIKPMVDLLQKIPDAVNAEFRLSEALNLIKYKIKPATTGETQRQMGIIEEAGNRFQGTKTGKEFDTFYRTLRDWNIELTRREREANDELARRNTLLDKEALAAEKAAAAEAKLQAAINLNTGNIELRKGWVGEMESRGGNRAAPEILPLNIETRKGWVGEMARTAGPGSLPLDMGGEQRSEQHWMRLIAKEAPKASAAITDLQGQAQQLAETLAQDAFLTFFSSLGAAAAGGEDMAVAMQKMLASLLSQTAQWLFMAGLKTAAFAKTDAQLYAGLAMIAASGLLALGSGFAGQSNTNSKAAIPSYDTGGYVGQTGLAMVHAGETVIPSGGRGGGGITIIVQGSVFDADRMAGQLARRLGMR